MSHSRSDDHLLNELDSIKGLLNAEYDGPAEPIPGNSREEEALPEEFLAAWEAEQRGAEAAGADVAELPEEFLVDVGEPEVPPGPPPTASSSAETLSPPAAAPDIPVLNDVVSLPDAQPDIPVLEESISPKALGNEAPDTFGATSWDEFETVVDLLVERRLDGLRQTLRKELLEELERAGLTPDARSE